MDGAVRAHISYCKLLISDMRTSNIAAIKMQSASSLPESSIDSNYEESRSALTAFLLER